jgi:hypothetical protein
MATAAQPLTDADIDRMAPLSDADMAAHEAKQSPEHPGYWAELLQQSGLPGLIKGLKEHPAETVATAIGGLLAPLNPNFTQSPQGQAIKENWTRSPESAAAQATMGVLAAAPGVGRMVPPELGPALKAGAAAAGPDVGIGAAKVAAGSAAAEMLPGGPLKYVAGAAPVYSGARQIGRGLSKGATAFGKTMRGGEVAEEAAPAAEAAPVAKTSGQALAEAEGRDWSQLGSEDKLFMEAIARGRQNAAAAAAEAPPANPTSSAQPSAQPALAAPPAPSKTIEQLFNEELAARRAKVQPIRPEPQAAPTPEPAPETPAQPQTAADMAKAKFAQGKADRFVKAIQDYNAKFNAQPITSDAIASLDDSGKALLARSLSKNGVLPALDANKFPNTSWSYIVTKLRQAEYAAR